MSKDKSLRSLRSLRDSIEEGIENLRQIQVMVSDFQPQTQPILNKKMQKIVTNLKVNQISE